MDPAITNKIDPTCYSYDLLRLLYLDRSINPNFNSLEFITLMHRQKSETVLSIETLPYTSLKQT